ncbi:MAG: hypothetical protein JWP87_3614 [Labilithrix sp.]|nr:hypothetical protein [Labilithrix sp.]
MRSMIFELQPPPEARAHDAETNDFDEARLTAKLDLLRASEWPGEAGRNPFEPIVEIWRLGYGMSAVVDDGVVLLANRTRSDCSGG